MVCGKDEPNRICYHVEMYGCTCADLLRRGFASEEEKHLRIMENIVEFVAGPEPGFWLENAEWHHLEEY